MAEKKSDYDFAQQMKKCLEKASKDLTNRESQNTQHLRATSNTQIATPTKESVVHVLRDNLQLLQLVHSNIREAIDHNGETLVTESLQSAQPRNPRWILIAIEKVMKDQEETIQVCSISVGDPQTGQTEWEDPTKVIQTSSQRLAVVRDWIHQEIKGLKLNTGYLWGVPAEVWESIFLLVSDSELNDYLEGYTDKPMRSTAMNLSHVCRYWRILVHGQPQIWGLVYGPPVRAWLPREYDLLTTSIKNTSSTITILTNLSHAFPWGYYSVRRYKAYGVRTRAQEISRSDLPEERDVNLHVYRPTDGFDGRIDSLPFRRASTLTITMGRNPRLTGRFFDTFFKFVSIRSLTITSNYTGGRGMMHYNIDMSFPHLKFLKLWLKWLPRDFQLDHVLARRLEEFHLYHKIDTPMLGMPEYGIELPELHTLGVSFCDLWKYQPVKVGALSSLILYGSPFNGQLHGPLIEDLNNLFYGLAHLRFEGWRKPESPENELEGVVAVLEVLARKSPALKSIRVSNSFVDGEALVSLFVEARSGLKGDALKHTEELTLSHTTGITQSHCNELLSLVQRLNVYI
ncbi:13253_t:CDS:1 [Acaulospora colombiana]|uniref:13253_t:CDS:1 n=1 Tax=Acaulospora colombiana TaxID=27376 RepID=A0ACA9NM10_9GLOM|nr:13253_t:CDS:1 [Acaulospora colombiana]